MAPYCDAMAKAFCNLGNIAMNRFCNAAALVLVVPRVWARPVGVMPYMIPRVHDFIWFRRTLCFSLKSLPEIVRSFSGNSSRKKCCAMEE